MASQPTADTEYAKQYLESQKVVIDYIKHITTLDTGSIILMALLLEKFFKTPHWGFLIPMIFIGFIVSIIALTLAALGVTRSIRTPNNIAKGLVAFTAVSFLIGLIGFLAGIISLAILAAKNW